MPTRVTSWINEVNTTSLRIIVSIGVAAIGMLMVLAAVLFFRWEPKDVQVKLLYALGTFLGVMMALDVTQFIGKRFSAEEYVRGKQGSVNVEQAGTVNAAPAAPIPPGDTAIPAVVDDKPETVERPQFAPEGIR